MLGVDFGFPNVFWQLHPDQAHLRMLLSSVATKLSHEGYCALGENKGFFAQNVNNGSLHGMFWDHPTLDLRMDGCLFGVHVLPGSIYRLVD